MPGSRIPLDRRLKDILQHAGPLPPEAETPLSHYEWAVVGFDASFEYVLANFDKVNLKPAVRDKHLARLYPMLLVFVIEAFERFLKETAAVCVDHLAEFVLDKRFDEFQVRGSVIAAHFGEGTIGKALCESDTWLDCKDINDRFRKLLADPFETGTFYLFPQASQQPDTERFRWPLLNLIWQMRHTIVHNVGVITSSDAVKFRLVSQEPVTSARLLQPGRDDVRSVRQFLDDTARSITNRVGQRLAELLTTLYTTHGLVFTPQAKADQLSGQFHQVLAVAGVAGTPPPP